VAGRTVRALFVSHAYVVGVNQRKLHALAAAGVQVGLLAPRRWPSSDWGREMVLERPYPEIRLYPSEAWFAGRGGAYVFPPGAFRAALRDFRPDIVQVEQEVFANVSLQAAIHTRAARIPLVVFGWENLDLRLSCARRWVRSRVLKAARLVVAGNREAEALVRTWGYQGPIEVMPQLGVDPVRFAPRPRPAGEPFTIGYVGRVTREKGIDLLLDAARSLRDRGRTFHIHVCGTGPAEEQLRGMSGRLGLDGMLRWRGAVSHAQVPEEIAQLDVLVLPSRTVEGWKEQFGHVLIEAMCMRVPAVGADSGEIPRVIGRDDMVFPENDAGALAGILDRLMGDAGWRAEVAGSAEKRVHEHYTDEQLSRRLLAAWRRVL